MQTARVKLAKVGLSVSVLGWIFVSLISASASVVCINYAKELWKFKAPDFIALVSTASCFLNLPVLILVWRKYDIRPSLPTKYQWGVYILYGVINAAANYIKAVALTLLPGSTYTIMFESDLIWNVVLSVTFLKRCYHPLQFLSPLLILGGTMIVSLSENSSEANKYTGLGKFGGVILALVGTLCTSFVAVLSDKVLKMMAKQNEGPVQGISDNLVNVNSTTEEQLPDRHKSKVWYQNMKEVRNVEFSFWSQLLTFLFLIVWTLLDPKKEYQEWGSYISKVRETSDHSPDWNIAVFAMLMFFLATSRLFVTFSMNNILMILSAFFFSVWKPVRRIGTIFLSIWLFGDTFDVYTGIGIIMDVLALTCFAVGGYKYKIYQENKDRPIDLK